MLVFKTRNYRSLKSKPIYFINTHSNHPTILFDSINFLITCLRINFSFFSIPAKYMANKSHTSAKNEKKINRLNPGGKIFLIKKSGEIRTET